MGVPIASGLPDTARQAPSTSTRNCTRPSWSKFYKTTVFGEIASTDYEGDITGFGAQVKIRTDPGHHGVGLRDGAGPERGVPGTNK